ncbi:ABSCISIC ACID-INSENSITIVE 5-like protein [Arachis hypogaea]|nr:ABSCISIC ACID-INSENSITIVE 5-like protein [Arachis hypogaea]
MQQTTMAVSGTKTISHETLTQELLQSEAAEPVSKQNSILSLTLDEIQCKSGKSFGSMSMDEFLASIWSSEDNNNNNNNTNQTLHDEQASQHIMKSAGTKTEQQQQGSFCVIPSPICKKTVEEVWSEIHKDQEPQQRDESNNIGMNEALRKQQTLGEMTLEDFLIKAGVVQESKLTSKSRVATTTIMPLVFQNHVSNIASSNRPMDPSYAVRSPMGVGFPSQQNLGNHGTNNNGLGTYPILLQNNNSSTRLLDSSVGSSRKRVIDGPPEVVVERRQRRMLKNRESAARSRARRQAYTVELEAELNVLKEENENLKQILDEAELKRKQEISQRKHTTKAQKRTEKLREIRRTISAAW